MAAPVLSNSAVKPLGPITPTGHRIAYYRVSTLAQSIGSQRSALLDNGGTFDKEFKDEGVSGHPGRFTEGLRRVAGPHSCR